MKQTNTQNKTWSIDAIIFLSVSILWLVGFAFAS